MLVVLVAGLAWCTPAGAFTHGERVPTGGAAWLAHGTCSGVLVAADRVLTAAHCVGPQGGYVRLGPGPRPTETIAVAGVTVHPRFANWVNPRRPSDASAEAGRYDIAILTLDHAARAKPLPVATRAARPGTRAFGYGFEKAPTARRAPQRVLSDATCVHAFPAGAFDRSATLCAGDPGPGPRARICGGDSGGPLVAGGRLVGLVTFAAEVLGRRCGKGAALGGYADVGALRAFAKQPHPAFLPVFSAPAHVERDGDALRCVPPAFAPGATITSIATTWQVRDLRTHHFAYAPIPHATGATYRLAPGDAGKQIRCTQRIVTPGGPLYQQTQPLHVG